MAGASGSQGDHRAKETQKIGTEEASGLERQVPSGNGWAHPVGHSKVKDLALGRLRDEKMEEMRQRAHPM